MLDKIECPKCSSFLWLHDTVHREAEGGMAQVTTEYLRCPDCGYFTERSETRKLPLELVAANRAAKQEMERRFGGVNNA